MITLCFSLYTTSLINNCIYVKFWFTFHNEQNTRIKKLLPTTKVLQFVQRAQSMVILKLFFRHHCYNVQIKHRGQMARQQLNDKM